MLTLYFGSLKIKSFNIIKYHFEVICIGTDNMAMTLLSDIILSLESLWSLKYEMSPYDHCKRRQNLVLV